MTHVAVVLPGASYGPEMPGLAIPIAALRARGSSVVVVEYPEAPWPDWRRAEAGDWSEVFDAIGPQVAPALKGADQVTLIAKSMGTSLFGGVSPLLPNTTKAVWLTPMFHDPDVRRDVIARQFRCLSVYGTEDPVHDPEGQAKVTAACAGVELSLEGAGHSLNMSDEQLDALRAAVESFLA